MVFKRKITLQYSPKDIRKTTIFPVLIHNLLYVYQIISFKSHNVISQSLRGETFEQTHYISINIKIFPKLLQ